MTTNDLPSYCQPIHHISDLHPTAQSFLDALNLPSIHPKCADISKNITDLFSSSPTNETNFHFTSLPEHLLTLYHQTASPLLAMAELWLRLFAFLIAPLCILYNLYLEMDSTSKQHHHPRRSRNSAISCMLGLISCAVIATDPMYIMEYGTTYGLLIVASMSILSLRRHPDRVTIWYCVLSVLLWTGYSTLSRHSSPDPLFLLPKTVKPGLIYSKSNFEIWKIAQRWDQSIWNYDVASNGPATPWLVTGDTRTGIPFIINSIPSVPYHRVWLQTEEDEDDEAIALDIAFPSKRHFAEKPIVLILHGLNGGSNEEYIKDFVRGKTKDGWTVVVMIARGLMDTPVVHSKVFHGARIGDVHAAAKVLRRVKRPEQMLAGVGYSMGAIILANYVASEGKGCQLDVAVSVSGGLDMRENLKFERSIRLWQPILAAGLRNIILNKFRGKYERKLTRGEFLGFLRSTSVSEIDQYAVVKYNDFRDIHHYYSSMSALGDTSPHNITKGRIANVSIPLLVVHALDDPLCTWRTLGYDPKEVVETGDGMLMMLFTKTGGHVGWPVGMNPRKEGWRWMSDVAGSFIDTVARVRG